MNERSRLHACFHQLSPLIDARQCHSSEAAMIAVTTSSWSGTWKGQLDGLFIVAHLASTSRSDGQLEALGKRSGDVLTFRDFMLFVNYLLSVMLRKLLRILIALPHRAIQLVEWFFNPKNGDEFVTPFTRRFLSTGKSLTITVLYHVGAGMYSFVTEYLFGAVAHVFNIGKDIVLDLWRANPSYTRWAARSAFALTVFVASGAAVVAVAAWRTGVAVLVALYQMLR